MLHSPNYRVRRLVAACLVLGGVVSSLAGCQSTSSESGGQPFPWIIGSAKTSTTGQQPPKTQTLPPVQGPARPQTQLPPTTTAPSAAAGEPLPSLAQLLNRPGAPAQAAQANAPQAAPAVPAAPPITEGSIRVAMLVPLSGQTAKLGRAMLNAAQMALFAFGDERLQLLPHDTGGNPDGAMHAAQVAVGDGATIILGPLLSGSVQAVAPIARAANVPVVAFSSDRTVAGSGVYVMGFLPSAEADRVIKYAVSKGRRRFGILAPNTPYGTTVAESAQLTANAMGAQVTRVRYYDPTAEDYTDVVRAIADFDSRHQALLHQRNELKGKDDEASKRALERLANLQTIGDLPFDALLVADGGKRLQQIAALLPFFDVDPGIVQILGTGQWDVAGLGAEPALVNGLYAAPDPAARADFVQQYKTIFGDDAPRLATLAYDAMALAAVLARGEAGPEFTQAALTSPSGFFGRDGIFRLRPSGITERGLAVLKIGRKENTVVDRAPQTFQAKIN